jgi:hypothetical protein
MAGFHERLVIGSPLPQAMSRFREWAGSVRATASASATPTIRPRSDGYHLLIGSADRFGTFGKRASFYRA